MFALLSKINKNLVIAIPAAMLAGFLFGLTGFQNKLANLIVPMTFLMVYPMMATLRIKSLLRWNDTRLQFAAQLVNFCIIPFISLGVGFIFFNDKPYYALGLFLASLLPTSGMTISWTGFAKGNLEAAVKMTVFGLTMGSLALPFYLYLFMGESVQFEIMSIIRQIAIIVFIPMIFGHLTRTWFVRKHGESGFKEKIAPRFSSFSTIGVLGIVFIAISLKSDYLISNLDSLLYILAASVSMYVINYLLSTIIGRCFFTGKDAIALVYGTVMRNLSIALAISMNSFGDIGSQIALVIAIAFIIQVQSAAWYIRFTQVLFKDK